MTKPLLAAFLMLSLATGLQAQAEFSPETMLKPKTSGLYTLPPNLDARTAYDTLGDKAGINVVYIPAFKADTPVPLRVDGSNFFDALNKLSEQTANFWFPWDSKTIIVAPNTQQYRRDLEPRTFKIFYLGKDTTKEVLLNALNAIRNRLQLRGVFFHEDAKAIVVYDIAANVAAAEGLISEIGGLSLPLPSTTTTAFPENSTRYLLHAENGKVRHVVPSNQAHLEKTLVGSVAIDMSQPAKAVYEDLASRASINVIFDRNMQEKPTARFHVEGVDLINALDLLALQTATFWQPVSESTIYVMDDNQQNRRDRELFVTKVIFLPDTASTTDLNATLNVLRTSLALRGVFQHENRKAMVIRDAPLRVFLAEKTVEELNLRLGKPKSVAVKTETSSLYGENGWVLGIASKARPQLEVKLRNKTTVRLREKTKRAFEALGGLAGLKVVFDPRVTDAAEMSFNANNVDILEAMDLLAWQTRHFWEVVDKETIRIIPDTQVARRELEPMIQKTIVPADLADAPGLLNVLRTAFQLRDIKTDEKNNILIRDTADNVAMAEKLVEILGQGATQQ